MKRDIIFCIELDSKSDVEFVKRYISLFFNIKYPTIYQTYNHCYMKESYEDEEIVELDLLQRGLKCLSTIYSKCKICETWLVYVGTGNINNNGKKLKDVTMVLLDKNPKKRECIYSVHKKRLNVNKDLTNIKKIENVQVLANSLKYISLLDETNSRIIKYKNYNPSNVNCIFQNDLSVK